MAHKRRKKNKMHWNVQTITSTISTSLVLILIGLVILLSLTARVVADSVKENLTVTIVLNDDVQTNQAKQLQDSLSTLRYVGNIDYISREQAMQEQIESMGIDPTEFLGANPFSISMEIKVKPEYSVTDSLQWISTELRTTKNIAEVIYQKDLVDSLNRNLQRASFFLLAIAMLLIIISLSLINNTVRLSVYNHRFLLYTMKLVGARWSFIRRPFLIKAFWMGIASAIIANAALFAGIYWAASHDEEVFRYVTQQNMTYTAVAILVVGLVLTILCTFFSVTHCLKMRSSKLY
ncbi:MAG: permease-like cell division protein FtsX [Bacteroidaceae bacterium]|nr:permease-like cell division protein FtsX [Bacteroidaceae bacterium]